MTKFDSLFSADTNILNLDRIIRKFIYFSFFVWVFDMILIHVFAITLTGHSTIGTTLTDK